MKRKLFLAALLAVGSMAYAGDFELKLGADLWRDTKRDQYDERTVNLDPGYSVGAEYIFDTKSNFRYGIGSEYKSQIKGDHDYSAHAMVPVYLLGRYGFENDLYLVGRAGWAFNSDQGVDIDQTDDGLYFGFGVGKELTKRINVELLYEGSGYEYESNVVGVDDVDSYYAVVSLKFGIVLGPVEEEMEEIVEEPTPMVVEEPEPVVVVEGPTMEPLPEAYLTGFALNPRFNVDDPNLNPDDGREIREAAEVLKGREGKLILDGHADSTGSEEYNLELSEKRAEVVKAEFEKYLADENIEIVTKGFGETMPIADNSTLEGRTENRRVEVRFEPKIEEMGAEEIE